MSDDFNLEMQQCFIEEARDLLAEAEQCFLSLEQSHEDPNVLENIFRLAHNLKGSAKAVGFVALGDFTHDFESFLLALKNGKIPTSESVVSTLLKCNDFLKDSVDHLHKNPAAVIDGSVLQDRMRDLLNNKSDNHSESNSNSTETTEIPVATSTAEGNAALTEVESLGGEPITLKPMFQNVPNQVNTTTKGSTAPDESIRVQINKIDELLNGVGELVIHQTVMNQHLPDMTNALVRKTIDQMSKIVRDVQNLSMSLRMIPLKQTFQKMRRIVRDTSHSLGKQVDLVLIGEETEIDKTVLEKLGDPLVHLVRNAVDHGLETYEQRRNSGKPSSGQITLSAYQHAGSLVIDIEDDGKGIDAQVIREKAEKIGLIKENQKLSEQELYQLIFAPGFSTKQEVTDVSGRGVGMNVVKTNINQLQGTIDIKSKVGVGTRFRVSLPLTMAIIDGVVVRLGTERFVVPLSQVTEFFRAKEEDVSYVCETSELITLRDETLPVYRLSTLFRRKVMEPASVWDLTALIAKDSNLQSFAVLVDEVVSLQQVVIKPIGDELGSQVELKGSAILGDGKPALIVDLIELTAPYRNLNSSNQKSTNERATA